MTYMLVSERRAREQLRVSVPKDAYHALKRYPVSKSLDLPSGID